MVIFSLGVVEKYRKFKGKLLKVLSTLVAVPLSASGGPKDTVATGESGRLLGFLC